MEFCCKSLRFQGLDEYPLRSLSILGLSNSTLELSSLLHGRIYPGNLHARILCVLYRFTQRSLLTPPRLLSRHKSLKHSTVYRKSRSETEKKFSRSNNLNVESIVDMLNCPDLNSNKTSKSSYSGVFGVWSCRSIKVT